MQNLGISPQNKGFKPRPRPGLPTVGSPIPQLRGFECKQSSGAGSVAKPGLRTPPVGPEPLRGKAGWGWGAGAACPRAVPPDTPSASPLPITLRWGQNPVACSENPPAYHDPTPSSFQGKGRGQPGGWRGAEPGFAPHLHTGSSRSWIAALQRGTVRLSSDEGAGSQCQPASLAEREGGGGGAR